MPVEVAEATPIFLQDASFYRNYLAMRNTADVTGGKPTAALSQSISGVSALNPLVAFHAIHGRMREAIISFLMDYT
jgi:hypothetical protein